MNRPPRQGQRPPTFSPLEMVLLVSVLAVAGIGLLLWFTAWLLTAGQLETSLAGAAGVAVELVADPSDPAGAWPEVDAHRLPGPLAFYSTLAALILVPVAGGAVAWARWRGRRQRRPGDAHWASRRDLKPLRVKEADGTRLVLGRGYPRGGLLATEPARSIIVLGPSRSGKTTGLAIPAILEWEGPVVATSVKTDLVRDTAGWRATKGDVQLYDPTGATGMPAAGWSPLAGCTTWMGAVRTAHAMAATVKATGTAGGLTDGDFWYASAAKLLAPLLFAAAANDLPIATVVAWLNTQEERHVQTLLGASGVVEARNAFAASMKRADNQKSSIYTTAETVLAAYEDPTVAASTATSEIDPDRLLAGDHTLYLCAPRDDQRRLRPLFVGLLHQVLTVASRRVEQHGGQLDRPLLVVLDEAANIAPLPDLDEIASTAMGLGITLVTIWQDLAQIRARYGPRATTIVNNHAGMLVLRGMRDLDALSATSNLLGRHTPPERPDDPRPGPEPLMAAHALRSLPEGRAVGIYQHLPPFQVQLRPHYATGHLRDRASLPLPSAPSDSQVVGGAEPAVLLGVPEPEAVPQPVVIPDLERVRALGDEIVSIAERYQANDIRVFGSVAAGTAVSGSNLNLLVDVPPTRRLLQLRALGEELAGLLGAPVEVLTVDMLQNPEAADEAVPLFLIPEPQP